MSAGTWLNPARCHNPDLPHYYGPSKAARQTFPPATLQPAVYVVNSQAESEKLEAAATYLLVSSKPPPVAAAKVCGGVCRSGLPRPRHGLLPGGLQPGAGAATNGFRQGAGRPHVGVGGGGGAVAGGGLGSQDVRPLDLPAGFRAADPEPRPFLALLQPDGELGGAPVWGGGRARESGELSRMAWVSERGAACITILP